jgi:2-polyprenyl-3-methyl-5-hydroxy-6-metoxy-1,4-benzoquinol methylase
VAQWSVVRSNEWTPEAVARFWDRFADDTRLHEGYFSRTFGAAIVAALRAHAGLRRGSRVLDLGCGTGELIDQLLDAGAVVAGVDQSPKSVALVNERFRSRSSWLGATSEVPDGVNDVVTCIETVEHLDDANVASLLASASAALHPGGRLFVTTPNDERLRDSFVYCPFCDSEFHSMQHVRSFTASSLSTLLEANGWRVEHIEATNLWATTPLRWHGEHLRDAKTHYTAWARARLHLHGASPHLIAVASPSGAARR